MSAIITSSLVTRPERKRSFCDLRDPWHRLDLGGIEGNDVEHAIAEKADRPAVDLHDDDDVERRCFRQALAEAAAQIDDRNDHAAQIEHAADIFRLSGKRRYRRPSLDLRTAMMSTPY